VLSYARIAIQRIWSNLCLIELPDRKADETTGIVKVAAGSITPSDVKNVEGKMEGTTLPRVRVFPLTDGVKAYAEMGRGQIRGRLVLSP
jgi:hypothetical protein